MRVKELQSILEKKKCDLALFYNSNSSYCNPNLFYFSKYSGLGCLVIPKKAPPFLIVPEMELEKAKKSGLKAHTMDRKRFFESVHNLAKSKGIKAKKIAIDNTNFNINSYRHFKKQFKSKTSDVALECLKLRETKTKKEIKILRKSCNYADNILKKVIDNFNDFKTEPEAAAFLEYETKKSGLDISFSPIVASGSNGSMPHHVPSTKINRGFCVIDFGVKYRGYCSDITRTIFVGRPSKKDKEIYSLLLNIQKNAISLVKKNIKCSYLYDFVCKRLGKYKQYFTHGLGHGVGVEIHELPNLSLNSKAKDRIRNDMVFTIEPGIYFPKKFGIRIEDTILFDKKPVPLTRSSKDLLII